MSFVLSAGPPRVFVSYAHESAEHVALVREFCMFLRANGVDANFDQFDVDLRQDWQTWTIRQLTEADYVIVVASSAYGRTSEDATPSARHGWRAELDLLRDLLYSDRSWLQRMLPVILPGWSEDDIPFFLMMSTSYRVTEFTVRGAESLLRVLFSEVENRDLERVRRFVDLDRIDAGSVTANAAVDIEKTASEGLGTEVALIARTTREQATREARRASRWELAHLTLGLPTAVLAAVAGATALASTAGRIPAAILALSAAAMSAAASFLGCDGRATAAQQRAAALDTAATDARLLATEEPDRIGAEVFRRRIRRLIDRVEAIRANDLTAAKALKQRDRDD